jgi:predicted nucleotidyltransferase
LHECPSDGYSTPWCHPARVGAGVLDPSRAVAWQESVGSRASGRRLKRFSDLDLAVEGKLTWPERAQVSDAFEESLLPFKVDVVELDMVDADFRERIAKDFVLVQSGNATDLD